MTKPTFFYERKLWKKFPVIIGIDEVGRGAIAGPVVAAAVAFDPAQMKNLRLKIKNEDVKINDSKKLRSLERIKAAKWIKANCLAYALGSSPVSYINKYGIVKATNKAFRIAIKKLIRQIYERDQPSRVDPLHKIFLLVDAFHIKYVKGVGLKNQKAIVKGDQRSISIAASSILAKVYRDRLMKKLSRKTKRYTFYKWGRNKGYGTKEHIKVIQKYGITALHRKLFLRKIFVSSSINPS